MSINRTGCVLTGDWKRLRSFLKSGDDYIDCVNDTIKEEADKIREAVQGEIPFNSVPNAPSTIRRKGMDSPLLEYGVLKEQIVVKEYVSKNKSYKSYFVIQGSEEKVETRGRNGELTYAKLLELMENGVQEANIPPRPVLTITFTRMAHSLEREIIAKAFSKIHEALR